MSEHLIGLFGAIGNGRISRAHDLPGIWKFDSARVMAASNGAEVVMSTPAPFSRSIGYFEPPALRNARYRFVAAGSPASTFSESAADAVNDVAYWNT